MNVIIQLQHFYKNYLQQLFNLDETNAQKCAELTLNVDENKQQFGDVTSNAALLLAKELQKNPREVAQEIVGSLSHQSINRLEIAGPGFINFFLTQEAFNQIAQQLYEQREQFFKLDANKTRSNFNIEFVSANPTGPLHLGHGRGGIIGDVLSNILKFLDHRVTKEFYINDAGAQITKLGISLKTRIEQAAGLDTPMPEDSYMGDYVKDLAQECIAQYGDAVLKESASFFETYAQQKLLAAIKKTLENYGIVFDVWFSEKQLHTDGSIENTLKILKSNGYLYEHEGALWFKSTEFGDDKDRVVKKSSGELTYVAADSAYLQNKADRGFTKLIMILGHDHHGYEVRLQGLRQALKLPVTLEIIFYQLVKMKASGQLVRMSKRAGNIVTLEGVIETVGKDVARFFYLHRKADAQLEFDLDLALKQTEENPVYYLQYAYVRTGSILTKAAQEYDLTGINEHTAQFLGPEESLLLKKIVSLQSLLQSISFHYQTHLLTYYAIELAQTFHGYYAKNRVIDPENKDKTAARLLMIKTLRNTFGLVFDLLGISKPERM